jgi:hypothetical protein
MMQAGFCHTVLVCQKNVIMLKTFDVCGGATLVSTRVGFDLLTVETTPLTRPFIGNSYWTS